LSLVESLHTNVFIAGARHYDMTLTSCARDKISTASDRSTPPKKNNIWLSVTLQNVPILRIVVHFQPVIKLLQKGVRVHHRPVILMQKNAKFFWGGGMDPPPSGEETSPPHPIWRLDLNPSHSEILPTLLMVTVITHPY